MAHKQPERDVGEPLMLTYKESCKKLGVSMSQLYTLMRAGEFSSLELGPQVRRIPMAELNAYVDRLIAKARTKAEQVATDQGSAA